MIWTWTLLVFVTVFWTTYFWLGYIWERLIIGRARLARDDAAE